MESLISLLNGLYQSLELGVIANTGDVYGLLTFILILLGGGSQYFSSSKSLPAPEPKSQEIEEASKAPAGKPEIAEEQVGLREEPAPAPKVEEKPRLSWSQRLQKGLQKTRSEIWGKVENLIGGKTLSDEQIEEVEELLYSSDMGPKVVSKLIETLEENYKGKSLSGDELKKIFFDLLSEDMLPIQGQQDQDLFHFDPQTHQGTKVVMIVGVNGAGKTTTIGKLAHRLTAQGAKVVVGACDTFRAAAVEQLEVWGERSGATIVKAKSGSNPSGVGYDALQTALNEKADYCILDTAGRLHTKSNLMDELTKSKNVLKKLEETAPHQTLLVIDAVTGQNALRQAQEFNKALGLTGLIFTKCDGSSKAGSAIGIVQELGVPITYIGVGENVEDLNRFELNEYLQTLLDYSREGAESRPEASV